MADTAGRRERAEETALLWALVAIVAILSLLPLARLLFEGVAPGGRFSTAALSSVLSSATTWTAAQHSLVTACAGTALAVLIGATVAVLVGLTDIRGRNAFVFCFVLPLMIAPQVVALAWLQLFGPSSTLLKMIGLAPAMGSRNALYSVSCLGNFGIPAFLGIPGNYLVLPTLIYQRLAGLGPSVLSEVAVLSCLIGFIAVLGILLQDLMLRRRDFRITTTSNAMRPFELARWRPVVEIALWILTIVVLVLPLIALLLSSLVPAVGVPLTAKSATWSNYDYVLFDHAAAKRAFVNSFSLSATAAVVIVLIAVPLAYFLVWRRSRLLGVLNLVTEMPYALPGVVLAIAAILVFLKPLPVLGLTLYNTVWIILFGYLARFLVLGLRPVIGGYYQLDRTLEEAAQIAGARLARPLV